MQCPVPDPVVSRFGCDAFMAINLECLDLVLSVAVANFPSAMAAAAAA
jgi:hypothetical protein